MNRSLEAMLDAALRRSPAQAFFRRRAARKLAVLAYHAVGDARRFAAQLDALARVARPVALAEVLDAIAGRRVLPDRAVLISFDDADRSVLEVAMPLLARRGVPAVAFVVAGALDTDRPLWPAEVRDLVRAGARAEETRGMTPDRAVAALKRLPDERRLAVIERLRASASRPASAVPQLRRAELPELEAAGIEVGNHTLTHACLDRCSEDRIAEEIGAAHRILAEALGRAPRALAYPNGNFDARARAAVAAFGYRAAFLFDHALSSLPPPDPLAISRLRVNATDSIDRLHTILSGLHPAVQALRTRRPGASLAEERTSA